MRNMLVPLVLLALLASACSEASDTEGTASSQPGSTTAPPATVVQQGELARADVERSEVTDATGSELAALVAGDTNFAVELFTLVAEDGNILLSPYSIESALAMTHAGARGETAAQMTDVLHIGLDPERLHTVRNELDLQIATVEEPQLPGDDRDSFSISVANSLWGQQGYPFLEEFLVLLAANYDAGMNLVDFEAEAEVARVAVNTWVEEETAGRIVDLIPEGVVDAATRLVLVNAIWFKASWAEQFDPERTANGMFTLLDGTTVTVPMMLGGGTMPHSRGDGFEYLRIPYAGDASMVVILPDTGRFDEIAGRLDGQFLADAKAAAGTADVDLLMPKFEFRSEFSLSSALQDLGMLEAFVAPSGDQGADFTGITAERELFIQEVVHQAFITVDETGTEAAAATAVSIGLTAIADPPTPVVLDRPFMFLIEHESTGEILFIGQVTNPAA